MADVLPGPSNSPAVVSRPGQRDRLVGRRTSGPAADASRPAAVLRAARRTAAAVAGPAAWRLPGPAQPDRAGSGDVHRPSPAHRRVLRRGRVRLRRADRGVCPGRWRARVCLPRAGEAVLAAPGAPAPSVLFDPPAPPAWLDLPMAQVASLRAHLRTHLREPRDAHGIRHDHAATAAIAAAALLAGRSRAASIAAYAAGFGQHALSVFGARWSARQEAYLAPRRRNSRHSCKRRRGSS